MEKTWNERYEDLKNRYEEFCENRVGLVSQLMSNCVKKKRRMVEDEDFEDVAMKLKDKDDRIDILEDSSSRLSELVDKLKASLKVIALCEVNFFLFLSNYSYRRVKKEKQSFNKKLPGFNLKWPIRRSLRSISSVLRWMMKKFIRTIW